eukprot:scaffold8065_cov267-Pinguiococcus_pyrenoidosus.AAC.13
MGYLIAMPLRSVLGAPPLLTPFGAACGAFRAPPRRSSSLAGLLLGDSATLEHISNAKIAVDPLMSAR